MFAARNWEEEETSASPATPVCYYTSQAAALVKASQALEARRATELK